MIGSLDLKRARKILGTICKRYSHTLALFEAKEVIRDILESLGDPDFSLDFDGAEYRLIHEDSIWEIYVDEIQRIVEECYGLNFDDMPSFLAFEIDWEQTAVNCSYDGYGHTFSTYDGSEEECEGYHIFRTN